MGFWSTQLSCPKCLTLCKTKGMGCIPLIVLIAITIATFGLGLIIGFLYFMYLKKQPIECPSCGFRWQP